MTVEMPASCYCEGSKTDSYRERFQEDLRFCRFVLGEHARIMPTYAKGHEHTWLFPLVAVADYLVCAAMAIEESMTCEHVDYREKLGEPKWLGGEE